MSNIEDGFVPETLNEVLLLQRIRELRIASYKNGMDAISPFPSSVDLYPDDYREPHPTVRLAVNVNSGWEREKLKIEGRTYGLGKASMGFQYYISAEYLHRFTPLSAAQMLSDRHHDLMRNLAKSLSQLEENAHEKP